MKKLTPATIKGELSAPASKSLCIRALAGALLASGRSEIQNITLCDDVVATLNMVNAFGAKTVASGKMVEVTSPGANMFHSSIAKELHLNPGESAFAQHLFAGLACLADYPICFHAQASLRSRPIWEIQAACEQLGVKFEAGRTAGTFCIHGPLSNDKIQLDGRHTSQMVSALLFALPLATHGSSLYVHNLSSRPYVQLSLDVLAQHGIQWQHDFAVDNKRQHGSYRFENSGDQQYQTNRLELEGDWSAAAFLLVAGAIAGDVTVFEIDPQSNQADKLVMDVLQDCGAVVGKKDGGIRVQAGKLRPIDADCTDAPDCFPPLMALAASIEGKSILRGLTRLYYKESNRAKALMQEFAKFGLKMDVDGDVLCVYGQKRLKGGISVLSHSDHRIAMALAIAALNARDSCYLDDATVVSKSYPDFFTDLQHISVE